MDIELDVFSPLMMNWMRGHIHSRYVVAENNGSLWWREAEFTKELLEPNTISHCIGDSAILRFCTRAGDDGLLLGGPADDGGAKVNTVSGG